MYVACKKIKVRMKIVIKLNSKNKIINEYMYLKMYTWNWKNLYIHIEIPCEVFA